MAKKKVYAIKEGFDFSKNERVQNKLVDSWSECQKYIKGVKGAIYKSFEDIDEAQSFLQKGSELLRKGKDKYDEDCLHVYVDGSYNSASRKYSYGVVAVKDNVVEYIHGGSGQNPEGNNIRQIAGELNAALEATKYALDNKHDKVVIFHDYEGICHHATGFWQRKDKSSQEYYEKMNTFIKQGIKIQFVQVKSHEEDLFNEMADTICKRELNIDNDGVLEKDGQKAEFKLLYTEGEYRQEMALEFVNVAKEIGISVNLEVRTWDTILEDIHKEAVLFGFGSGDPSELYNLYYGPIAGGTVAWDNAGGYNNEKVNEDIDKALDAKDEDEALPYWKDRQKYTSAKGDAPYCWLVNANHVYLAADGFDFGNPVVQPHGGRIFDNVNEWSWK